ncbi:MAG: type II toxin-antitoxin system VapC family toxin [Mesorhizobium sp.]|nr:type II toxin-antitoxin system VapC family toxin [Mesorhizobium sp.]
MTIIDASVATAWFADIQTSVPARLLLSRATLAAPNLLRIELTNALLKYVRAGLLPNTLPTKAVGMLEGTIFHWRDDRELLAVATKIAVTQRHKIYDCLYLALALERREPLATADRRLAAMARDLSIETELIEPAL